MITERPLPHEYDEYFNRYVKLVPDGDLVEVYINQMNNLDSLISNLSETESEFRYAEGKWSIKEIIGHLCDAERMFSYIIFRMIRGDSTLIPAINLTEYVNRGDFNKRSLLNILEEWKITRHSTYFLIKNLKQEDLQKVSTVKNHPITVLASACILLGHVEHHINVLNEHYNI